MTSRTPGRQKSLTMSWEDLTWTLLLSRKHDLQPLVTLKEKDYTFFWQGNGSDEPRDQGVGFAVRNSLLRMVEPGSGCSERLLTLSLNSATGPVTQISVYAPTLSATPATKDMFYEDLASIIRNIPSKEQVVLDDFNARVGADHSLWPSCIGHFRVGKMNENGHATTGALHLS